MLRNGMGAGQIFIVLGLLPLVAAVAILLLGRDKERLGADATLGLAAH
jgi:hypothetical protein